MKKLWLVLLFGLVGAAQVQGQELPEPRLVSFFDEVLRPVEFVIPIGSFDDVASLGFGVAGGVEFAAGNSETITRRSRSSWP